MALGSAGFDGHLPTKRPRVARHINKIGNGTVKRRGAVGKSVSIGAKLPRQPGRPTEQACMLRMTGRFARRPSSLVSQLASHEMTDEGERGGDVDHLTSQASQASR